MIIMHLRQTDVGCINIQLEIVSKALSPLPVNSDQIVHIAKATHTTNTRSKLHRHHRPLNNPESCKKVLEIVILDSPPQSPPYQKHQNGLVETPKIETPNYP